ncbi:thioesterase II family protein [Streptomyces alkaliterrae]|uniref:Alpha/beta fold hydrolase n=1 Tax=Streptomyces alkaliterrae TaxID=2213162 RepID=A0A5P0YM97_9ACTN|nr:alpha/beta fold hydrolase [Streptomyces alkaliterrae]MBB1252301.1 thioesterase [Streptomyces alkaliterrae]MBB1258102.1 thioesterase [Streptomyces alkaliterrae]MQS00542.1 alpha/beta fold hydrolase [Streptomyces alkaliterrae]
MTGDSTTRTGSAAVLRSRWLSSRRPRTDTTLDLYCFAHAGGSPGEFLRWSAELPGIRLWAVRLPGRAPRQEEPPYTRMTDLVTDLVEQVDFGSREFAFFGHSLGALIAFETTRALRRAGLRQPRRLFLSSMRPPPVTTSRGTRLLSDEELLTELERRWGALPQAVHEEPELRTLALNQLRADAALAESHEYLPEEPLDVPLTAFAGDQEDPGQLGWHVHTRAAFDSHVLRGGHFYFRDPEQQHALLELVRGALDTES